MDFFNKYLKWLLVIFIGGILVTWVWFTIDGFFSTGGMDKSVWLSFWGGFLAFIGTLFLGLVSIWQNDNARGISDRMLKIEETKCFPILDVEFDKKEVFSIPKERKDKLLKENYSKNGICYIGDSLVEYSTNAKQPYNFLLPKGEYLQKLVVSENCNVLRFSFKIVNKGESTIKSIILHGASISYIYNAYGQRNVGSHNKRTMILPTKGFNIYISAIIKSDEPEPCYSEDYAFIDMTFVIKALNDKCYLYTMKLHLCNNALIDCSSNCDEALERDRFGL